MSSRRRRLLEALVDLHQETGQPVSQSRLARRAGIDLDAVRSHLESFEAAELVRPVPGTDGYAPTVTAREFLELDLDGDTFVVVEPVDDEE